MDWIMNFLGEAKGELRHVTWPTRQQTIAYTAIIIGVALFIAGYIAVFDYIFKHIVQDIIIK